MPEYITICFMGGAGKVFTNSAAMIETLDRRCEEYPDDYQRICRTEEQAIYRITADCILFQ